VKEGEGKGSGEKMERE